MRHFHIQTSFTSGELSPRLEGRVDLAQYQNGLSVLENFLIHPHGGVSRRGGSMFVAEAKLSTKKPRLIPFEFSLTQAYVLEFGDQYIRVFKDNAQVIEADPPTVANGDFETAGAGGGDIFANWTENAGDGAIDDYTTDPYWGDHSLKLTCGASDNTYITSDAIAIGAPMQNKKFLLTLWTKGDGSKAGEYAIWDETNSAWLVTRTTTGVTGETWTKKQFQFTTEPTTASIIIYLYPDSSEGDFACFDLISIQGYPVEITSPYSEAELFDIYYTQSADTLYLDHENHAPRKLTRSSHTSWTLSVIDFIDGPYLDTNTDPSKRITPDKLTGSIKLTAEGFQWNDNQVGALWRLKLNDEWGYVKLGSKDSATVINATVKGLENEDILGGVDSILNGDMELDEKWINYNTPTTNEQSGEQYHEGEYSRKFVADAVNDGIRNQTTFKVAKGQSYQFILWVYPDDTQDVKIIIRKGDGSGDENIWTPSGLTQDAWNKIAYTYTSTATGSSAYIAIAGTGAGTWYVDDVSHRHITGTWQWREGAWSDLNGYPSCVTFFEGRLFHAASPAQPQTIWGSVSNDFENFTPGADDDDAVYYTLGSDQVNVIQWIAPSSQLILGTAAAEFRVGGGANDIITPSSINIKSPTSYGGRKIRPVRAGTSIMFVQRAGKKLREYAYSLEIDNYKAESLTILAEHITGTGIVDMAYQQEPDSIVWCARDDGVLLGLTYEKEHKVIGWHRHITDGVVESVCVIPAVDESKDELWMVVKRTIGGATKRYIEYLDPELHTDCSLTYDGAEATKFAGLEHLEGKSVQIVGDGAVYPSAIVTQGKLELDPGAESVKFGLGYTSKLKIMRPEVETTVGTSQGRKRRWARIMVRVYETLGAKILGEIIPFRSAGDEMDSPPPIYSGFIEKSNLGWDLDGYIEIIQEQPLPMTILQITGTLEISNA